MKYRKLIRAFCAPLVFAALVSAPAAHAQKKTAAPVKAAKMTKMVKIAKDDLPTAEAVLDKYVEATGGAAAYEKITSQSVKATVTIAAQNLSGTADSVSKAPDKVYIKQTFPGIGEFKQGYNGTTGWADDPISGLRTLSGVELNQFKSQAVFNAPLRWREIYSKAEMTGIKDVDGKPAYAVLLTEKLSKKTRTEYYDTKTGLQVKSESVQEGPQGTVPVETYYSDYRTVDGVKVPYKVRGVLSGAELLSVVTEYKNNVPVDDSLFVKPSASPAPAPAPEVVAPEKPAEAPATPETPTPAAP